jgi:mannose-6-phosphate isomerase-like protein (cupin superfamily)
VRPLPTPDGVHPETNHLRLHDARVCRLDDALSDHGRFRYPPGQFAARAQRRTRLWSQPPIAYPPALRASLWTPSPPPPYTRPVRRGGTARPVPAGVEILRLGPNGQVTRRTSTGETDLSGSEGATRFIDPGQRAWYLVGDAGTSPERPSNATYKLGMVRPHSSFTPHAHAGEHWVLALGYASCGVHDAERDEVVVLTLTPGDLVRIPAMLPHSFGNRSGAPLLVLAANTGYGLDHEDYAVTARAAEERADAVAAGGSGGGDVDYGRLAAALRRLEAVPAPGLTAGERAARALRRVAAWLE